MEYLYRLDTVWKDGSSTSYPIKINTIVHEVTVDGSRVDFTVKETGERFRCHYPWALAENTPENLERIKDLEYDQRVYELMGENLKRLRKKIVTLDESPEDDSDEMCDAIE